jgi:hypothetical protein
MAFVSGNVQRTWRIMRKPFQSIPVRGTFSFVNGNPSGVFVKISPTTCARPTQDHLNNPHFEFRTVLNSTAGNLQLAGSGASKFRYYSGLTVNVSRSANCFEVNPSNVIMEANHGCAD